MSETMEAETETFGQRLIPLEQAAASLVISQRHLRALLEKHGFTVFHLGPRSKRIAEEDFRALLKITSAAP
jgi:hypothetical protein